MQSINIVIEGYWRDQNKRGLPAYPGIFFVYQTKYNAESDMVSLINVIYVGEADNIRERVATHPLYPAWISYLNEGEQLCFSWAYVDGAFKTMVKAAFIF